MKREVAERITFAMRDLEKAFGELGEALSSVEDQSERDAMLRTWGWTSHLLHIDINVAIARRYPDLHPEVRFSSAGKGNTCR